MARPNSDATNPTGIPVSDAVLQLIADAREESAHRRHEYIGTEHLLLALSRQTGEGAPLRDVAVEPERVYSIIDGTIRSGRDTPRSDIERPLTTRTKTAFSFAWESAQLLGHRQVGVADLLVGFMRERMNIAAQVLQDAGLTLERANEYARLSGA